MWFEILWYKWSSLLKCCWSIAAKQVFGKKVVLFIVEILNFENQKCENFFGNFLCLFSKSLKVFRLSRKTVKWWAIVCVLHFYWFIAGFLFFFCLMVSFRWLRWISRKAVSDRVFEWKKLMKEKKKFKCLVRWYISMEMYVFILLN